MSREEEVIRSVEAAERAERIRRGLPPDHLTDITQFPFAFTDGPAALERYADEDPHLYAKVMAALARKDYEAANACMTALQTIEPHAEKIRMKFGHVPAAARIKLPDVVGDFPKDRALFLACDLNYLRRYAVPLLMSIAGHSAGARVHIHLIGADIAPITPALRSANLDITTSHETDTLYAPLNVLPNLYFGAVRLIRYCQAALLASSGLTLADVDGLVTGDIRDFLEKPSAAIRVRPGRVQPWHQYSACLIRSSPETRTFFERTLAILLDELPHAWWGLDQYALFSAAIGTKPVFELVGPEIAAVDPDAPGLFWFTAGQRKLTVMTDDNLYARQFRRQIQR